MKRFAITLTLCLAITGLGAGAIYGVWANRPPVAAAPKEDKIPNVAVQIVRETSLEDLLYVTGSAEPWESVTISAETTGKIEWQGTDDGERVTQGQELIKINTTPILARRDQARAQYTLTGQEFDRVELLRKDGISSPQEYDRAVTNRQAAKATLRLIEIELDQSFIKAPFDGVVDYLHKEEGEFVTLGVELVRLVQVDKIKVVFGLPERDVPNFDPGDEVRVAFDAYPGKLFRGVIHRIATTAEAETRTFRTEIEVDNAADLVRPGMVARAVLVRQSYPNAITAPLFAVLTRDEQRYVFVEKNGVAQRRPIEVGFYQAGNIHVIEGIDPGDNLIVAGQRDLRDGQIVRIPHEGE